MAGRVGSSRAPRPSSTSSNAGSTDVPPGATRPRISLTASTASTSASTASSSQAPAPAAPSASLNPGRASRAARRRLADRLAGLLRVGRQQLALLLRQLGRHDDIDEDVQVAALARPPEVRHAPAAQPDLRVGLGPGLDLDLFLALDRRDRDPRPERGLGDRDLGLVEQLGPLAVQASDGAGRGPRRTGCRAARRAARPRPRWTAGSGGPRRCRPGSSPAGSACVRCGRRHGRSRTASRRSCPRHGSAGRRSR